MIESIQSQFPVIIENKRTYKGDGVYVGRPSILGNPYKMRSEFERPCVIRQYKAWLWTQVQDGGAVYDELHRLYNQYLRDGTLTLICYCAPKPCHADIIRDLFHYWLHKDMTEVEFPNGEFPS